MAYRTTDEDGVREDGAGLTTVSEPSTRIAFELAEATGKRVDELEPLAETVDPEALDGIFGRQTDASASVTFTHEGYSITVTGNGAVTLTPDGR